MNKWTPPRNSGGILQVSTIFSLGMEMSRLTREGTAEPVSREKILRYKRGQGFFFFFCSADHVQDWQPYPFGPYSCYMCDHTYMHERCDRDMERSWKVTYGQEYLRDEAALRVDSFTPW